MCYWFSFWGLQASGPFSGTLEGFEGGFWTWSVVVGAVCGHCQGIFPLPIFVVALCCLGSVLAYCRYLVYLGFLVVVVLLEGYLVCRIMNYIYI